MPNVLTGWEFDLGEVIGGIAAAIFYGRFYLQWYYSERAGRSVVPIGFWYMSSIGSLLLFGYGVYKQSPVGTLAHCFNIFIYARNLTYIWRGAGALSRGRALLAHGLPLVVITIALGLLVLTWLNVFQATQARGNTEATRTWFWIVVGVVGQGLFACRFVIQWLATEKKKESVIPVAFWYFSMAASLCMCASFVQLREWVFAVGVATTFPIYARNLWIIHRGKSVLSDGTPPNE